MSDTPKTDGLLTEILDAFGYVHQGNCPQRWVNHSRELERELNRACEMYRKLDIHALNLVDRIRRLEEAGDAVAAIIGPPGSAHWADENQVDAAWNNWLKAKEAKP